MIKLFTLIKPRTILKIILLIVIVVCIWKIKPFSRDEETVEVSHMMVIKQVEQLGNLEVAKYSISDVMEYTKRRTWLPNSKVALLVMGEVIACVDLSQISDDDVTVMGDTVRLTLPVPKICSHKVDHSKSKVYDVRYGLWETYELVDEAYKDAERQIYNQAIKMGIDAESKENTRKALTPLMNALGFNTVYIDFKTWENDARHKVNIKP